MSTTGVLYLALGLPHLSMALLSIKTLRKFNKDISVCVLTNVEMPLFVKKNDFNIDVWRYLEIDTKDSRVIKTSLYDYTPFDKTIFIDTDTVILEDISSALIYLDYFDICIKQKNVPYPDSVKGRYRLMSGRYMVKDLPHWNSGVIMFKKNDRVEHFFKEWSERFNKLNYTFDQIALVESILFSDCKILSLEDRWNFQDVSVLSKKYNNNIVVVHYSSSLIPSLRRSISACYDKLKSGEEGESQIEQYFVQKAKHRMNKDGIKRYIIKSIKWLFWDLKASLYGRCW